jgi:CRISPR-associated protein Cas2
MSRHRYLVSYDICHPKRLRKVAEVCEGFGTRLQYSVFECPLDAMRLAQLKSQLAEAMNMDEDRVLFVSLGLESSNATLVIEALGLPYQVRTRVTII